MKISDITDLLEQRLPDGFTTYVDIYHDRVEFKLIKGSLFWKLVVYREDFDDHRLIEYLIDNTVNRILVEGATA
jgi:hypothetical protein